MADEYEIKSFNEYDLSIGMIDKASMQNDSAITRGKLWNEIKAIRAADPNGGIIPLNNRVTQYGSRVQLINELTQYHIMMRNYMRRQLGNQMNNDEQIDNQEVQIGDPDGDQPMRDNEEEEEPIPIRLLFQISSPDDWLTGDAIASWFGPGVDPTVPNDFVNQLGIFVQSFFGGFSNANYTVSLLCKSYNEKVMKHVPAKYNPLTSTVSNFIGNQHKVMRKKGNTIAFEVGSYHVIISFNMQKYIRNDAPRNCDFRIAYIGAPEQFKQEQQMIESKDKFEIAVGELLGDCINIMKSSKRSRLDVIAQQMLELEQQKDNYSDNLLVWYEKMDALRKERGMLLETVEIKEDELEQEEQEEESE